MINSLKQLVSVLSLFFLLCANTLAAAPVNINKISDTGKNINVPAILIFVFFVAVTLFITWWAASHTKSTKDFYAAGGRITGFQNGLAIAGDFMSAATFLGITGLIFIRGFDGIIWILAALVGLCLLLFLLVEAFRNLGRFTLSDVASYRLNEKPIRTFSALTSLVIIIMYLISQMVGAGALIQLLFGLPYEYAVVIIGALMVTYVSIGGMMATTWVQIIKAILMIFGISILAYGTMAQFDFSFIRMYMEVANVHQLGIKVLQPGALLTDSVSIISLSMALVFGLIGMPHILMRLFTVPDVKQAYRSLLYATSFIGYVFILVFFIIGFGAIVILSQHPEVFDASGRLIGGNNMTAIHLSKVIGGDAFLGFISAIVFATILAVVAGLTIAGASAISHDLYANVFRHGKATEYEEIRVSKIAAVCLGAVSIALAILFEKQNIAYIISMVFAISASANFPLLILSVYWKGLTTRGAIIGGSIGLFLSVGLMIIGPTIWVEILGNQEALFPYRYPALFSMTAGFISIWLISILDNSETARTDRERFDAMFLDVYLGKTRSRPST